MDILVSKAKDIIDLFLSLANKYGWVCLAVMVKNGAGTNNIFRQVEQIRLADTHHKASGYFGITVIENVGNNFLPKPLVASSPLNLYTSAQEVKQFYDILRSDMISK